MDRIARRDFLRIAGTGVFALALPRGKGMSRVFAAPGGARPTLVVIYLRGGQDALNVLVPWSDKRYYDIRPTIAIAPEASPDALGVVRLDKTFGLHPALAGLKPFYDAGKVAPFSCAGSPHATRSHFDAQDFMEYAAPGLRTLRNGWLNRYLSLTREAAVASAAAVGAPRGGESDLRALAMQPLLPRALRGDHAALAVPEQSVLDDKPLLELFDGLYGERRAPDSAGAAMPSRMDEDPVFAAGHNTIDAMRRFKQVLGQVREGPQVEYPNSPLGMKLRGLSRVIKAQAGLEVACVDVGGWDHHANEGGEAGTMATMLKDLGVSLADFMEDLGPRLDDTMIVTMTEFGRTCQENGNNGTDHGHGGTMFLMGGKVRGGKVYGDWNGLEEAQMYEGRDLPVAVDFRDVFAEVLTNHMGFEPPKGFFPDYKPAKIKGLFG